MEHQLLRHGRIVLLLRDILLLEHLVENNDLPLLVLVGVDIRVVDRGVVRNADERGAFGKVELAHALAEINLRRRLHALAVFAERDDVEIELHDLLFRVLLLKFQSCCVMVEPPASPLPRNILTQAFKVVTQSTP